MSCEIHQIADITDVSSVKRHLFPADDNRGGHSWLEAIVLSSSPAGDILVLARGRRLVSLQGKWDNETGQTQFVCSDSSFHELDNTITSVLCLPIVIQSHSSQVGPDWTCIAVAFDNGSISFYCESFELLFEERFHHEAILSLKCQSQHSPRPDLCPDLRPEELYVVYESLVCVVNGNNLFSHLRHCRSSLAKGMNTEQNQQCSLNIKKWSFEEQRVMTDAAVIGLQLQNTFDHLYTASLCGGFESKYRAMPPHNSLVLAIGAKPFLGFHYALEGAAQPVFSDVAKAVASKLKSALPGWLTGGKTVIEKTDASVQLPSEAMIYRFGICDMRRNATRLIVSPDRRLAAISDSLGRVLLLDTARGVVVRVFKGCRDAQCAFIQVPDERKSRKLGKQAVALFLVIYAPKKGTIEIVSAQQGIKVCTFTASKASLLVYVNYGLLGFQNTSKSRFVCALTCFLIDGDGKMKEIRVPFHFALAEKHSKRSRDVHLFKRLKEFVKTVDGCILDEAINTFKQLSTNEVISQCFEMLASSREVDADVLIACSAFLVEKLGQDANNEQLLCLIQNVNLLTHFYDFIANSDMELDVKNGNFEKPPKKTGNSMFSSKEMANLQQLLDLSTLIEYKMHPKVTFESNSSITLSQFLAIFDYTASSPIRLKAPIDDVLVYAIAEKVFAQYIHGTSHSDLGLHAKQSSIAPEVLFSLLLMYWVSRPIETFLHLESDMEHFSETVFHLSRAFDTRDVSVPYNCVSQFWTSVRKHLENSLKPFPAYVAAVLCKGVAQRIEHEKECSDEDSVELWEKLSQENCQWTLLIGKLEDVSLLNIILSNRPICEGSLPKLRIDMSEVSLKCILESGRGSVSEIVAQWLAQGGVNPEDVLIDDLRKNPEQLSEADAPVFYHLGILKKQFPHSLEPSVVLANMCWEYALHWQKDVGNLQLLDAALKCLSNIPSLHIKAGVYCLVWNTHIKIIFESCAKLINKVGKLPKERLCKQDTDLTDYQMTLLFELCVDFFDCFMQTLVDSSNYEKPSLRSEALWENNQGAPPLVELALCQNAIHYDIVHVHYQLAMVFHMMTVFALKHAKILTNLFDAPVSSVFFSDLLQSNQRSTLNVHDKVDSKTNGSRVQFLLKVISSSLDTVVMNEEKVYSTDHVAWVAKTVNLARLWDLDIDFLKRYQIVQILTSGFDTLALDLLPTITDKAKLGPDLVKIAGKRLTQLLSSSKDLGEQMAACSTKLTKYLDCLDGDWCAPSTLENIMMLITHALRCLEEKQPEHKIACLMLETCSTLQEIAP